MKVSNNIINFYILINVTNFKKNINILTHHVNNLEYTSIKLRIIIVNKIEVRHDLISQL